MRASKVFQYARQWKSTAKELSSHSIVFAQFLSLLHVADTYICSPTLVYGPSMLPTLNFTGDVVLAEKLSPLLGKVRPGDVVLVRSPENPRKTLTKRVLGMEGDTVTFLVDPSNSDRSRSLVDGNVGVLFLAEQFGYVGLASYDETATKKAVETIAACLLDESVSDDWVYVVPKGHVWIQGDNIYASNDSRHMGPIPYGLILGKVFCRVWPPEDFGPLRQWGYQEL